MLNSNPKFSHYFKPLPVLLMGWLLLTGVGLIYCYVNSLDEREVLAKVQYKAGSLVVLVVYGSEAENNILKSNDRITQLDEVATDKAINSFSLVTPLNEFPLYYFPGQLELPLNEGQEATLLGARGATLTIIRNDQTLKLNLAQIPINTNIGLLLNVQLVISLLFWLTSLVLFLFKPDRLITACFLVYFNLLGLYLLVQVTSNSTRNQSVLFVISAIFGGLFPIIALYFVMLFPYGNKPGKKTQWVLGIVLGLNVALTGLRLWLNFPSGLANLELLKTLSNLRIISFGLLLFTGMVILIVRFVRSKGVERLKIRLLVAGLIITTIPPLVTFLAHSFFGLFDNLVRYNGNLISLPTVIIPFLIIYSILKHNLFYTDLLIRKSLVYVMLTIFLSIIYFSINGVLSLVFSEFQDNLISFLAFLVMVLCVARAKVYSQKLIDRIFYSEGVNCNQLLRKWTGRLTSVNSQLENLLALVVEEMPGDFKCASAALVIIEEVNQTQNRPSMENLVDGLRVNPFHQGDFKLTLISSPSQNSAAIHKIGWRGVLELLIDLTKLTKVKMTSSLEPTFPSWFNTEKDIIDQLVLSSDPEEPRLIIRDIANSQQNQIYHFLVAFPAHAHICGGLLMGYKLSGQLPNPEELSTLIVIAQQLSLALETSLKVQQELALRQIIQNLCIQQENLRLEEHKKVALELHDTVKQRVSYIDNCLGSWLLDHVKESSRQGSVYELLSNLYQNNQLVLDHIKYLINHLNPQALPSGLVVSLRKLVATESELDKNRVIVFKTQLGDKREMLNYFTDEENIFIFRLVQEAITNAVRHSDGNYLEVNLTIACRQEQEVLMVEVQDNGKGFNTSQGNLNQLVLENHFGLLYMRERTRYLGGEFYLASTNQGTLVKAIFPVHLERTTFKELPQLALSILAGAVGD